MAIRLRFAVTGSTGLVGRNLVRFLRQQGHEVIRVVRPDTPPTSETVLQWNPQEGTIDKEGFEGLDAVIHTAGANLAQARWTPQIKKELVESRVQSTSLLAAGLARLQKPPQALVSLSASGFYGFSHGAVFTETDGAGEDFLAQLCRQWEEAAEPARKAGIRVVHPRMAVVLSAQGGALARMLLPFKWGLGGKIATGRQPFSWISLDDAVAGLSWLARNSEMEGPVNLAAPHLLDNRGFTEALGSALRRPTVLPLPAWVARLAFGELADAALLQGQNLSAEKLLYGGFNFRHVDIDTALAELLDRDPEELLDVPVQPQVM